MAPRHAQTGILGKTGGYETLGRGREKPRSVDGLPGFDFWLESGVPMVRRMITLGLRVLRIASCHPNATSNDKAGDEAQNKNLHVTFPYSRWHKNSSTPQQINAAMPLSREPSPPS